MGEANRKMDEAVRKAISLKRAGILDSGTAERISEYLTKNAGRRVYTCNVRNSLRRLSARGEI
jgi:hypothetical protein